MQPFWERVAAGRHAAVVADRVPTPPADLPLLPLRVTCRDEGPREPLLEARSRLVRLGSGAMPWDVATSRLRRGLRRRLLGEGEADPGGELLDELGRLASQVSPRRFLVLDAVDRADEATIDLLLQAASTPGRLAVPVLAVFRRRPTEGPLAELAAALDLQELPARAAETPAAARAPAAPAMQASAEPTRRAPEGPEQVSLPPSILRVLRAAVVAGDAFDVGTVASVLRCSPLEVLEALQEAADAGLPLEDRGRGRLALPPPIGAQLRRGLLPSLREAWLALRTLDEREEAPLVEVPTVGPAEVPLEVPELPELPEVPEMAEAPEMAAAPEVAAPEDLAPSEAEARVAEAPPEVSIAREELEAARLLQAGREAFYRGGVEQALALGARALGLLESLEESEPRRQARASVYAELAHMKRDAAGGGSLSEALALAEQARDLLAPGDPARLVAGVHALVAGICHDLGDRGALERALEALTDAIRSLEAAGEPLAAARLLNDQAAVWVRLGDPVRAAHLLRTSKGIFASRPDDPDARLELAETEHLLARLPFHVPARPGQEGHAVATALEHARHAETTYREGRNLRELARTWETIGRLELRAGRNEEGLRQLSEAAALQQRLGDAVGLARTAGALAEGLAAAGRLADALSLLRDSVALNLRKGSPLGLHHNRAVLAELRQRLDGDPRVVARAEQLARELDRALAVIGPEGTRASPGAGPPA